MVCNSSTVVGTLALFTHFISTIFSFLAAAVDNSDSLVPLIGKSQVYKAFIFGHGPSYYTKPFSYSIFFVLIMKFVLMVKTF